VRITFSSFFFSSFRNVLLFQIEPTKPDNMSNWPLRKRKKWSRKKKKERESIPLNVVVWTTDERVCVYICILMRATWFHPYFSFLFFPLSLFNMYGCICVPTSMINHIVLSTQWNLAIISDGGDVNHIKIKNRERKQQVIYSWFLAYLPWWMNSCWCS